MSETMTMPEVDRAAASDAAVRARQARARIKGQLREGSYDHRQALVDSASGLPEHAQVSSLRVTEFLETLPFVGPVKRKRMMADLGISDRKRLGGLGHRQQRELWDALDAWLREHPAQEGGRS